MSVIAANECDRRSAWGLHSRRYYSLAFFLLCITLHPKERKNKYLRNVVSCPNEDNEPTFSYVDHACASPSQSFCCTIYVAWIAGLSDRTSSFPLSICAFLFCVSEWNSVKGGLRRCCCRREHMEEREEIGGQLRKRRKKEHREKAEKRKRKEKEGREGET